MANAAMAMLTPCCPEKFEVLWWKVVGNGDGWERNPRLFQEMQGDIPEMTSPPARRGREDLPPRSLYPAKTRSVTQPCSQPELLSRHQDTWKSPARRVKGVTLPLPIA